MKTTQFLPATLVAIGFLTASAAWGQLPTPTAYYPFEEGVGNMTADASPTMGPMGTLTGGWAPGHIGDFSIDLNGANNRVNIPTNAFAGAATTNDTISFSFWANQQGDIANSSSFWAVSPTAGGNQRGAQAHAPWGNGTIFWDTAGCCGGNTRLQNNPGSLADNEWHHFAFVKDGANKSIYVDGAQIVASGGASPLLPFSELLIGAEPPSTNSFNGLIDDFAVFDVALTQENISDIFNGTPIIAAVPEPTSVAIWSLMAAGLAGFGYYRIRRR